LFRENREGHQYALIPIRGHSYFSASIAPGAAARMQERISRSFFCVSRGADWIWSLTLRGFFAPGFCDSGVVNKRKEALLYVSRLSCKNECSAPFVSIA